MTSVRALLYRYYRNRLKSDKSVQCFLNTIQAELLAVIIWDTADFTSVLLIKEACKVCLNAPLRGVFDQSEIGCWDARFTKFAWQTVSTLIQDFLPTGSYGSKIRKTFFVPLSSSLMMSHDAKRFT